MSYSEGLNIKHESEISPEILDKLNGLTDQIDPRFIKNLEDYRSWVLDLLSNNAAYADHPTVREELEKQNARVADVFSNNYEKRIKNWEVMKAANEDDYWLSEVA